MARIPLHRMGRILEIALGILTALVGMIMGGIEAYNVLSMPNHIESGRGDTLILVLLITVLIPLAVAGSAIQHVRTGQSRWKTILTSITCVYAGITCLGLLTIGPHLIPTLILSGITTLVAHFQDALAAGDVSNSATS